MFNGGVITKEKIEEFNQNLLNERATWWMIDGEFVHCTTSEFPMMKEFIQKQKSENGCHVCDEKIFYDKHDKCWVMRIENYNWNSHSDGYDYNDIAINFCYECGKDYRNLKGDVLV